MPKLCHLLDMKETNGQREVREVAQWLNIQGLKTHRKYFRQIWCETARQRYLGAGRITLAKSCAIAGFTAPGAAGLLSRA